MTIHLAWLIEQLLLWLSFNVVAGGILLAVRFRHWLKHYQDPHTRFGGARAWRSARLVMFTDGQAFFYVLVMIFLNVGYIGFSILKFVLFNLLHLRFAW